MNTSYAHYFRVNDSKVTKILWNTIWIQITSLKPLHPGINDFYIQFVNYQDGNGIYVGLITEDRKNEQFSGSVNQINSIGFKSVKVHNYS